MARTFAALVIDSDLKGLEALVYGFQGAEWRITACPAPETAAFLVKASGAEIVVVASREPHDKTLALVRQLRSQDETRALPLLVLGPASLRARVLEIGTVDFLSTPVFVHDVITACRIAITVARDSEPKIEGSLTELSLLSLLRCLSGLGRSGVMQVERAGRRGEVLFSEGELTGAQLGALHGSAALHHLLMWEDGKVSLQLRMVGRRAPVNQRFDQVIDEAERFLRDYSHAVAGLGSHSTIYDKNEAKLSGSAQSFPSEVMPIVRLCDGQRSLADLIDQSPFRVFDTIRIVTRLVDLGAIKRRQVTDGKAQPAQDLQKFWESARIASPDDNSAPALPAVTASTRDSRVGEPNRRKLQRRARAETPVLGTPLTELVDAKPPAAESAAIAQPAPGDANKGKDRTSGVLQVPTSERRQSRHDRRERPSVTIDVELVEAALEAPTPPPVAKSTAAATTAKPGLTPAAGKPVVLAAGRPAVTPAAGSPVVRPLGRPAVTPAAGSPVVRPLGRPAVTPAAGSPVVRPLGKPAVTPAAGAPVLISSGKLAVTPAAGAPVLISSGRPAVTPAVGAPVVISSGKPAATPAAGGPVVLSSLKPALTPATGRPVASPTLDKSSQKADAPAPVAPVAAEASAPRPGRITGTLVSQSFGNRKTGPVPVVGVSVSVDPALASEASHEKAAAPISDKDKPASPGKMGAVTASNQPIVQSEPPRGTRVTGTLSISSSQRTSVPKTASKGVSVQLDPVLVAELDRLEKATVPGGNPASADAPTAPIKPSSGNRITGTLSISSSHRSPSKPRKTPGHGISVALDPSFVQEAQKPTVPASTAGSSGKEPAAGDPGAVVKRPSQPMAVEAEGSRAGARISGAFDAVESDFFAREADLYKREGDDNFADLDEPAGRAGSKNTSSRRQNRR